MISSTVVKTLFALSGNTCGFSDPDTRVGCELPLTDPEWDHVRGEICHIRGRRPGSARFDVNASQDEIDEYDNLILMCPNHHQEIDYLRPERYAVEVLQAMKERAEARARELNLSEAALEQIAASMMLSAMVASIAEDARLETRQVLQAEGNGKLTTAADVLYEPLAHVREVIAGTVSAASGDVSRPPSSSSGESPVIPFDRLRELADTLLAMRHMFNVQHASHRNDQTPWMPEYGSREALDRTNLLQQLAMRLAPLSTETAPLPATRSLLPTINWSNTMLEQAIQEVKELMAGR